VNDGSRLGKIATDYAYYGLTDPGLEQSERDYNNKANTDAFIAAMWDVLDGAGNLLLKKHRDYGPSNIAGAPGGPLNGLRVRMWDKTARINHLIDSGATPENESLRDSFIDLLNYSAIALLVLDGKWPE
jgi:hypothetical protein